MDALVDLKTFEITLCRAGKNEKKRFPIFKSKEYGMDIQEVVKAVIGTETDGEKAIDDLKLSEKGTAAAKAIYRIQKGFADELPKADPKPEPPKAPVMAPEVEAIFKAQKDELETVKKSLKDETDKRQMAEWVEKTRTDLSHFPGKSTEEIAKMLKDLNDLNPTMAQAQFESMKAASAAIKNGAVLKSQGGRGEPVDNSAEIQIDKLALTLVEKSADNKLTKEQAVAKVIAQNPALYEQYLNEHSKQTGR
jgi:hypothetical protein